MRKSVFYPVLALALGAVAAALRVWQRTAAYDPSGLPVPMAPSSVILVLVLAACAAVFLVLALGQNKTLDDPRSALPQGAVPALLLAASGVLLLLGGMMNLKTGADGYFLYADAMHSTDTLTRSEGLRAFLTSSLLPLVMAAASVPACIALLVQAKHAKNGGELKAETFTALMPPLFSFLWLIEAYRQHTANPIVWDYVLLLFAVVSLLLSGHDRAGFSLGVAKPRRAAFLTLLALFFAAAALPDSGGPANAFTLIALALQAAAELNALLLALEAPQTESTQQEDAPNEQ